MENLLNTVLDQTIPKTAFKFIVANIIIAFIVMIVTLSLVIKGIVVENVYRIDYLELGIFAIIGNMMLIITGLASIKDYKKAMRKRMEEIKNVEEYCKDVIKKAEEQIK